MKKPFFLVLFLSFGLFFGCAGEKKPDGFPELYLCVLTITQGNAPLANADVVLHPDSPELQAWSVGGTTDERGETILATQGKFEGAPKGAFTITVVKEEREEIDKTQPGERERDVEIVAVYTLVDESFRSPETSPLKITIDGRTRETFDVGEPVRDELAF